MKVDKPRYKPSGLVECEDCPLQESARPALKHTGVCGFWRGADNEPCPTKATYQDACDRADSVAQANGEPPIDDPEEVLP